MNNVGQLPVLAFISRCQYCWRDGLLQGGRCEWMISPVYRQMEPVVQTSRDCFFLDNIKNENSLLKWRKRLSSHVRQTLWWSWIPANLKCADMLLTLQLELSGEFQAQKAFLSVTYVRFLYCCLFHWFFLFSDIVQLLGWWSLPLVTSCFPSS